ncbi:hypothetical protein [Polyangium aurulentum]|uniref:hypothetical protein n=1 Tax=Polyangium aurulentum TaxID=2567896 RepID=UPI0010ADD77E|nr:hypothetical protein [Polyangium aurulentum]UQA63226.1 hypothetical protein E8A73_023285 [Polyangium aurulentum]
MHTFAESQVPTLADGYSITWVRTGGGKGCPSGGMAGSAMHGATVGGSTSNDRTQSAPSHIAFAGIALTGVHVPSHAVGASKGVPLAEGRSWQATGFASHELGIMHGDAGSAHEQTGQTGSANKTSTQLWIATAASGGGGGSVSFPIHT